MVIIGYSGHAFVCVDVALRQGILVEGYCDKMEQKSNPFGLDYLGTESDLVHGIDYFVGIGDNQIRERVTEEIKTTLEEAINLIHPNSTVADSAKIGYGVLIAAGSVINPLAKIGDGVICNSNTVVEHECEIGSYAHIAPGAVLTGNVSIGQRTFVGANSVIRQGVVIGDDVIIGAGSVILKDVPSGSKVVGNPGKIIN